MLLGWVYEHARRRGPAHVAAAFAIPADSLGLTHVHAHVRKRVRVIVLRARLCCSSTRISNYRRSRVPVCTRV